MKTPDEIKRGLWICSVDGDCNQCPYFENLCVDGLMPDNFAYIRQLEREKEALINIVKRSDSACLHCKHFCYVCTRPLKEIRLNGDCFEWRGVEEEER